MKITKSLELNSSVQYVKGVGPKRAEAFKKLDVYTAEDLFFLLPRRYEDRREPVKIADVEPGLNNCIIAEVDEIYSSGGRTEAILSDETGEIKVTWFTDKLNFLSEGMKLAIYGQADYFRDELKFTHPQVEIIKYNKKPSLIGKVFPIYPATASLTTRTIASIIENALEHYGKNLFKEFLPKKILLKNDLMNYHEAICQIHSPDDENNFIRARYRLAFDELFLLQLGIMMRRASNSVNKAKILKPGKFYDKFIKSLPFKITKAQKNAINEIFDDLANLYPMNRLLQGDVGSGKTLVAVCAILAAVDSGTQAVFMAPTEILAHQHYIKLEKNLSSLGIKTALLTGGVKSSERKKILQGLSDGSINVLIGTHAVFSEGVNLQNPGLVIIDEQHRFGVMQRNALISKGEAPHVLAMTATPIPRTLVISVYGDLNISTLDEMPPGRKKIITTAFTPIQISMLPGMIRERVKKNQQIYWVCPLIEQSERDLSNVTDRYEILCEQLPEINIKMLHGRMSVDEKRAIMKDFSDGKIDLLVSTVVIEVGVDVPNATLMIIQDAGQFGLAQLHQLRGRIGRGKLKSECILLENNNITPEGLERIKAMVNSSDGFELAEEDLIQRGPGAVCGTRQHGVTDFRVADLIRDKGILNIARENAREIFNEDPDLNKYPKLKFELMRRLGETLEIATTA